MNGEIQEAGFDRQYLRKKWNCVDKQKRGFLSRREVIQLIASMDILFDRASFTTAVMRSTIGHSLNNEITFSQFDSLIYQLRRRPDLEIIWNRILNGYDFSFSSFQPLVIDSAFDSGQLQEVIGINDVRAFWYCCLPLPPHSSRKASQGRDLTEMEARALVAEEMGEMYQGDFPVLSYNGFINIMTHVKNDGYDPVLCLPHARDMCYLLQHYFISCSDGLDIDVPKKEVKSNSLLEDSHRPNCYANAINSGSRALELRCYEARVSPSSNNIDVFVGRRKLNSRVTFKGLLPFPFSFHIVQRQS